MPGSVATGFSGRAVADGGNWKIWPEDVAQVVRLLLQMPAENIGQQGRSSSG